ncbi:MAG: polysaccharide biosynthesis tyrosine autokinase [Isosphaeraceae bacterium]
MSDHTYADEYADPTMQAPQSKGLSFRIILRALKRHWWQALLAWAIVSAGMVAFVHYRVKPTFDASARIKIELTGQGIFAQNTTQPVDFAQYMETQVSNLSSPTVIQNALRIISADPRNITPPMLRTSIDPEGDVRRAISVGQVPRTNLIQVSMSSEDRNEGPLIVNAVVKAFLDLAKQVYDESTQERINKLKSVRDEQEKKVERLRTEIADLNKKIGTGDLERAKSRNISSVDTYRRLSESLTQVEIEIITAKTKLDQLHNMKGQPAAPTDDASLSQAITDEFYADPHVAVLQVDREKAQRHLKEVERLARNASDPSRQRAEERLQQINEQIDELWGKLSPVIRRKLTSVPHDESSDKVIAEAEANLSALKTQAEALEDKLAKAEIKSKESEGEVLQLEYRRRDHERAEAMLTKIQDQLSQLELDARTPVVRTEKVFDATPANRPNGDRRFQMLASAPVISGLLIMGLLVFLEFRGARVADPEELAARINVQVLGVVPPLPQIRATASAASTGSLPVVASDLRAQRQLDEFVQSLDHLRVALCSRRDQWGRDRHCYLITSACGSEGKTTLAAQLAERCVNAGLMTLLVDGDLRNPTLSRMLDAADQPGLINVLRGESRPEDVVMVVGDAGGFHLLPAGNPRVDPSRLLASERLGKFLAQARESFDMIIVDAPPVLPVPDALTIGRWTDGAVLAVRYDTSRFPLVEKAYRRLTHVGVHVIGAVVNGVRSSESTYGGYAYGYGSYGTVYGDGTVHDESVNKTSVPPGASEVDA